MSVTDERTESEAPVERRPGARWRMFAVIGVAVLAMAVLIVILIDRSGDDDADRASTSATTEPAAPSARSERAEPARAFSWDGDDLTEWVTVEEMDETLQDVWSRYLGVDVTGVFEVEHVGGETGWSWKFGATGGPGTRKVLVHNGDHRGRYLGTPIGTDPRLPPGVTYEAEMGFGFGGYILQGPHSDELVAIHLAPLTMFLENQSSSEVRAYEDLVFAVATTMLHEMGWADPAQ